MASGRGEEVLQELLMAALQGDREAAEILEQLKAMRGEDG